MLLSDTLIDEAIKKSEIIIDPYDPENLAQHSYDCHLGNKLKIYTEFPLDAKKINPIEEIIIPKSGYELKPNTLYLGSVYEYLELHKYAMFLDGKSSIGRLGLFVHVTAGKIDVGWRGNLTFEIIATHPTIIYPGMLIGQMIFMEVKGNVKRPYNLKHNSKYLNDREPMESKMYKNFK